MKTKEELNVLKEEVETVSKKLAELSDKELEQVTGGYAIDGKCPEGLECPSMAICPGKGCREYSSNHPLANNKPYCDYFCQRVY